MRRFTPIEPGILESTVDTGPTLETWAQVPAILKDMAFMTTTMAVAYDAAVYSLGRHRRGVEEAADLPIGAAIGDPYTGRFFAGFAQDKELGDPDAHAEVMAIRHALDLLLADTPRDKDTVRSALTGLTLATTLEPCPTCLGHLEASGISRVTFGASRAELEESEILRRHGVGAYAPDIVRGGRTEGRYGFEFFKFPDTTIQTACVEIFASFGRDLETERVRFDPEFGHATRYNAFTRAVDDERAPHTTNPHPAVESQVILDEFIGTLALFDGRNHPPITSS